MKSAALLDALEVIAKSEANHARLAVKAGQPAFSFAIANAQDGIMTAGRLRQVSVSLSTSWCWMRCGPRH